jgi:hypothetical protein
MSKDNELETILVNQGEGASLVSICSFDKTGCRGGKPIGFIHLLSVKPVGLPLFLTLRN